MQKQKELAAAGEIRTVVVKHGGVAMPKSAVIEKKMDDVSKCAWDPVPPLAPLSHPMVRQTSIIAPVPAPTVSPPKNDDDSNSTNQSTSSSVYGTNPTTPGCIDDADGSFAGFEGLVIPGHTELGMDGGRASQVVSNNKMLADLLEKKSADPPFNMANEAPAKRKIDAADSNEPANKRAGIAVETVIIDDDDDEEEEDFKDSIQKQSTPSDAANAYAKLAASLLEDEDMEMDEPAANTSQEAPKSVIAMPMQRQIIVSPNNPPQMILAPSNTGGQLGQATATIKTDTGFQTVPLILQHSSPNQGTTIQIQKPMGGIGQQLMQPVMQQQQTQYVLATNQQGQTYLLAQQQQPPVNQILLTQSSQQQGGGPTKTIIILQQQSGGSAQGGTHPILGTMNAPGTPQKMIMTTQQGQQMIVTQVPRPMQHHVIVSQHSLASTNVSAGSSITTTCPIVSGSISSAPHIVPHVQLQQTQAQISLPPGNQSQAMQIQKVPVSSSPQPKTVVIEKKPLPEKKVFVTGSGNIEITEVQHSPSQSVSSVQTMPAPIVSQAPQLHPPPVPQQNVMKPVLPVKVDEDAEWLFICDWRGCQRRKFRSANEVYLHACSVHCPDSIDPNAEIYCQWGAGPNLCDNLPRKRFSLMTHINDRHCSIDALKAAVQRRLAAGPQPNQPTQPVTIIKNPQAAAIAAENPAGAASPSPSTSSTGSANAASSSAAMQAIKRHTIDMINSKEMMVSLWRTTERITYFTINRKQCLQDENEGPVTKSIRLTAALILRNLVNYTSTAKRYVSM